MFGETLRKALDFLGWLYNLTISTVDEPDFGSAMFRYPKDMIRTMGFLAITPAFLKP